MRLLPVIVVSGKVMPMRGENWRFWLPVFLLFAMGCYSGYNLATAHIDPEVSAPKYDFERRLPARRGSIYSCYGVEYPLVKSVPCWEYHLDPCDLTNAVVRRRGEPRRPKEAIVKTISDALGLDYRRVKKMCDNTSNRYQLLAISSDPDAHRTLIDSSLVRGVSISDRQVRQYLHGRSLSHVLGSVNSMCQGSAGIELRFDRELTGTEGLINGRKDARQRELYDKRKISIDPIPGSDIFLTIDHNIQFETENALKWGLREYGADSGWAIVMDSSTGAVLAMASFPDFDPVSFGSARDECKVNRAVQFNYEPGSVMKVITAAAAIDSDPRRYSPLTMFDTDQFEEGYYKLPGDHGHPWPKKMSLTDAIVKSSNIVIGKLSYDLGAECVWRYMRAFGFGGKTGIDLPGEQFGILPDPRKRMWDKASRSRAGIGQFLAVTGIQLASAFQAIANDGVRMRPYVVDRIVGHDGEERYKSKPEMLGSPIKESTARTLRKMMTGVAAPGGTARRAAIRGYSIAGKTGTAQKARNGRYVPGLYRATFCGIVPSEEPKLVVLTTLDFEKNTRYHQGGNSAGPVFKRITSAAIRYLGIAPDRPDELDEYTDDEFDKIIEERAEKYGIILEN